MKENYPLIRKIYLYVFSFIGLLLIVIGLVRLVDLGLKVYIFKKADVFIYYPQPARIEKDGTTQEMTPEEEEKFRAEQEKVQKEQAESQRQREASNSLAMIIIGAPLFFYHWRIISRERE